MSYQVIARKWRPQTFEEVTGQEAITRTLQNAINLKRLHHAYLFAGPRGVGKTTTARLFAKAINCKEGPTIIPCGNCTSCLEIASGNSIDVLEIDAASHTGVDNIREVIINTIANRPARDRYKIFIIDEVHMLSTNAFNALLKTLEEPPPHTLFILATTELHKLPETVLSRCQQFEFRVITIDKIAKRLELIATEEKINITQNAISQIARAGRGSMRDAQSALDQVIAFSGKDIKEEDVRTSLGVLNPELLEQLMEGLVKKDPRQILLIVNELVRIGYDLRQFLSEVLTHIRNLLVLKTIGIDAELLSLSDNEYEKLQSQEKYFSKEDLLRFFTLLTEVEQNIRTASEPRFQLEMGLIKLTQLANIKSLDSIIENLEKLSAQLSSSTTTNIDLVSTNTTEPIKSKAAIIERLPINSMVKPSLPTRSNQDSLEEPPWIQETPPIQSKDQKTEETETIITTPSKQIDLCLSNAADLLFKELKTTLDQIKKMWLLTALEEVQKVEISDGCLILTFPEKAKEFYKQVSNPTNTKTLEDILHQTVEKSLKLKTKIDLNQFESAPDAIDLEKNKMYEEAIADPTIQSLLKTFKGRLVTVTPPESSKVSQ